MTRFAAADAFEVAREFVEVETGKGSDALDRRPSSLPLSQTHAGADAPWSSPSSTASAVMSTLSQA